MGTEIKREPGTSCGELPGQLSLLPPASYVVNYRPAGVVDTAVGVTLDARNLGWWIARHVELGDVITAVTPRELPA